MAFSAMSEIVSQPLSNTCVNLFLPRRGALAAASTSSTRGSIGYLPQCPLWRTSDARIADTSRASRPRNARKADINHVRYIGHELCPVRGGQVLVFPEAAKSPYSLSHRGWLSIGRRPPVLMQRAD